MCLVDSSQTHPMTPDAEMEQEGANKNDKFKAHRWQPVPVGKRTYAYFPCILFISKGKKYLTT